MRAQTGEWTIFRRVHGYLAHKKQHPPMTLQKEYAKGPMQALVGGGVSYERGTPVEEGVLFSEGGQGGSGGAHTWTGAPSSGPWRPSRTHTHPGAAGTDTAVQGGGARVIQVTVWMMAWDGGSPRGRDSQLVLNRSC